MFVFKYVCVWYHTTIYLRSVVIELQDKDSDVEIETTL